MNTRLRHWLFCILCLILTTTASAFYDPHIGRWINRDPIGEDGGLNIYGFCLNNAVLLVDRNGREIVFTGPAELVARAEVLFSQVLTQLPAAQKRIMEDAKNGVEYKCSIAVTANSKLVVVGDFELKTIDLADMMKLPNTGHGLTFHAAFIHEVWEQWLYQSSGRRGTFKRWHKEATQAEAYLTGNQRILPDDNHLYGSTSIEGYLRLRYKSKVTVVSDTGQSKTVEKTIDQRINVKDGNVVNVNERILD